MRLAVIAALLFATACAKNTDPPPPTSGSPFAKPESGPAGASTASQSNY